LVRQYEDDYKAQHNGVKPSGTDRGPIRPLLKEYFELKKQLKQMSLPADSSDELLSKTAPAKLSGIVHQPIIISLIICN